MISQRIAASLTTSVPLAQSLSWLLQLLLVAAVISLFSPAYIWIFDAFLSDEHQFQLIGVVMILAFLAYKLARHHKSQSWSPTLQLRNSPVILLCVSIIGFVLNEHFLAINIISACLAILALYAISGFYSSNAVWRQAFLPTLLLIILLPFGDYLDVYLGFPLRLLTAYASADMLSAFGYASMSSETVIVLENQYANVDLSCSGIKGMWSGLAFFVLLTWLEGKSINLAWLWRFVLFAMALITANIIRVTFVVLLGPGLAYFEFANLVHEMLGIIGFAMACLIGWGLLLTLKQKPEKPTQKNQPYPNEKDVKKASMTIACLFMGVVALTWFYTPLSKDNVHQLNTRLELPQHWSARSVPLASQEEQFFNRNNAIAHKYQINPMPETVASLIAVHSTYWKGQHDPKNCLVSQGYQIVSDKTLRLSDSDHVRYMKVLRDNRSYVAVYWFQSPIQLTSDYSQRLFSSIFRRSEPWVLVSLLVANDQLSTLNIHQIIAPVKAAIGKQIKQVSQHES